MGHEADRYFNAPWGVALLWIAVLAGPLAWFLHQQVSYGMATFACSRGGEVGLHVATAVALLIAAGGALIAWRNWSRVAREGVDEGDETRTRSRFMAIGGFLSSLFFGLVIVAQWLPVLFLRPCQ
jgi:hypothetical protein